MEHDIVVEVVMHLGCSRLHCLFRIDYRWQELHLHFDHIHGILRRRWVLRHHHGHWLADKPHLPDRQGILHRQFQARGRRHTGNSAHLTQDVVPRQDRDYPRVLLGRLHVQAGDARVGIRAAQEGGVQGAGHRDIIDILPQALDQCRILTPLNPSPDEFG
jgi:hypothetical protein